MHLKKVEWCESWMTDEERRIMKKQMAAHPEGRHSYAESPAMPVLTFATEEQTTNYSDIT